MKENRGRMVENERLTHAEIWSAIRYLDPDLCAQRTRENDGTILGICITTLIAFWAALVYIYFHSL